MAVRLSAEASLGASTEQLSFQSAEQVVSVVGQRLKFCRCDAPLDPDETRWFSGSSGYGIALVATCPRAGLFAYTERKLQPQIQIFSYPSMMAGEVLSADDVLEFTAIAFLRSGKQIAALSGLPAPTLFVWSLAGASGVELLAKAALPVPCDALSLNPSGDGAMCTLASKKLLMWSLRLVYQTYLLTSTEVEFEQEDAEHPDTCMWNAHAWGSSGTLYAGAESGTVTALPRGQPASPVLRLDKAVRALVTDGTHMTVGCADGSVSWFLLEELDGETPLWTVSLGRSALRSLVMAPDYGRLLATTADGEMHLIAYTAEELPTEPVANPNEVLAVDRVASFHTAPVVCAAMLPHAAGGGKGHDIITCSEDGTMRCTDARTRLEVARVMTSSAAPPTGIAASAASLVIALGSADGVLHLYQRHLETAPLVRLGWRGRLGAAAVTRLAFSADGAYLAASCADGLTVVFELAPHASEPTVRSHVSLPAMPTSIAWTAAGKLMLAMPPSVKSRLLLLDVLESAVPNADMAPSIALASPAVAIVEAPSHYDGCTGGGATTVFALCQDKKLHVYEIPKVGAVGQAVQPLSSYSSHEKMPTALALSPDGNFVATAAKDGFTVVRSLMRIEDPVKLELHDSVLGGVAALVLVPNVSPAATPGSALVYSCGADGVMFMTVANPFGKSKATPPSYVPRPLQLPEAADKEAGAKTVLEIAAERANAPVAESAARDALAAKVQALKHELDGLLAANAALADDDLEKLTAADFVINEQQQAAWRQEGTHKVNALKAKIEEQNITNQIVSDRMHREFWQGMETPLSTLHGLPVPGAPPKGMPKCLSYTVPQPKPSVTKALEKKILLYPTFQLHTPWRKAAQMLLHGEQLRDLKIDFNNQLTSLLNAKRGELERIKERQARILEIISELERLDSKGDGEPTERMGIELEEEPDKLLEVVDQEIKSAKYISPQEQIRLDKLAEEKRARELAESGDTLGKRGLNNMMGGTLETRREEEAIFITLVKPEWMDTKDPSEFTEDDKKEIKEFAEKQKKLAAERDKRSKGLSTELLKTRQEIVDICTAFNDRVNALRDTKLVYDSALHENELLTIRLAQAKQSATAFRAKSNSLADELQSARMAHEEAAARLADFEGTRNAQAALVEEYKAQDKELEKGFKRDFADAKRMADAAPSPEIFDALKKLFNRRKVLNVPKGTKAAAKAGPAAAKPKAAAAAPAGSRANAAMLVAVQSGASVSSDAAAAGERSGVSYPRDPYSKLDAPETEQMVEALDAAVDMPEGISFDLWDRLVEARDTKIEAEEQLKVSTATLGRMNEFYALLSGEEERLRLRIDELEQMLKERSQQALRGAWNLELPFKLKQGQVEVEEAAVVTDFSTALLIHRSEVVDLNREIRKLGAEKVTILKEIRDFRKGIVYMQWEGTKADMEAADLTQRTKDFQLLRVTKELQETIRSGGQDNHAIENAALERKLEQLKLSHEEKMADLRRQLEGSVLEREMIYEIQSKNSNASGDSYKRFEEMHMKRKLQTLVGMQMQEIGLLREELDRLRRRTFPTFTHIDHRQLTDT
ncbi:wd repeat-containing protein 96 [Chrysochromulina tobinii]|uniref:Wd repeat-containing protein 96 n=1 Tax=Chrysochromulina tobinii TaxID=1460289 RepID=A0A0M0JE45_9EUKA|nr:wd repeat-containing protein 96 [Chrysochromulina tobinii]|eukprot:KOO24730.1 wd repeat-containing protein 96 [Chrysochromulina sp. CCMP291]